ncbi:superfamily II DNA/RNA helicase [Frigoribacterium sp. PhB107]|uniref:DEAD/DEAH box helicase n=1 Tax=Frigoribacterium sp. PhB107 TaxID=2485172 RepID=UPI000F4719F1|nr:DEAD/DEAH box helicase [Frigoribacterium sp. PhB107]ROP72932.1 superfamily II DNA/RNA helicase [Frigoribacterium sp. PhB107]
MPPYDKTPSRSRGTDPHRKPGSKSSSHRGHRPDEAGAPERKNRWNSDARAERRGEAPRSGSSRPNWEPREKTSNSRFAPRDHDARNAERGRDGGAPRFGRDGGKEAARAGRDGRPARSWDRDARPARDSGGRDDRGGRPYDRDARPARRDDRNERPARRDDRAPKNYTPAGRPPRDDQPARSWGDRPERGGRTSGGSYDRDARGGRDDRAPRSFDRDSRGGRDDRAPRSFDRGPGAAERNAPYSHGRDGAPRRPGTGSQGPSSDFYPKRDQGTHYSPEDDVKLEKLQAEVLTAQDVEGVSFGDLGLGDNIERQLASMGAAAPFAIQAATIPDVLAGRDVLGRGRTGSGKTIAFGAPLVEKLMENNGAKNRKMGRRPRALILAPTRELAMQIDRTVQPIARSVGLFTTQVYGGVPQARQVGALNRGVDIVIGTPGRIEDLIDQGRLDLSEVVITVLDEADHMCDLGFLEPVQRIIRETAQVKPNGDRAQKLLFSATLDKGVAKLVDEFLVKPAVHEVAGEDQASSTIDHRVLVIEQRDKTAVIEQLASGPGKTLVFARTRAFAEQLTDQLEDAGIRATSLHGDLNQARRTRNLGLLTSGKVNVLVATDVAARGIHVDDIELVVQADMPDEYKTYLHRSGRTGRAGKEGTVVTLITRPRRRRMEELLDRAEIEAEMIDARSGDALVDQLAGV